MKKLLGLIFCAAIVFSCEEEGPLLPTDCVEVSLVDQLCGQAVFKIQDPNFYHLGESANGHENVFFSYLHCDDPVKNDEGNFFVEFVADESLGSCAVCLALLQYDGEKVHQVRLATCE